MKFNSASFCIVAMILGLVSMDRYFAQAPATTTAGATLTIDQVIDKTIDQEQKNAKNLANYHPLVETYLQQLESHEELGAIPKGDKYFLGKLDLQKGVNQKSLLPAPGLGSKMKGAFSRIFALKYLPDGFAEMLLVDTDFQRADYEFEYIRREFIGEVRCYVLDVEPKPDLPKAAFRGRIWVEDQDFNIVRFNGTYIPSSSSDVYFHFDSWRENLAPGLWLPAYVYIEESELPYFFGKRKLQFKGQTRIWGYNIDNRSRQDELTTLTVESDQIRDDVVADEELSPIESLRAWERHAEDNVLNRLERAGLLAPAGEVNKVLETVTNNIEITNNLNIQPPVRARVLLTSPLESFSVGHTIVLSRGLVDVLPDEASLATFLAHELAHIALGHQLDTKFGFNDRTMFEDDETFQHVSIKRDQKEEIAADKKAAELLNNSPYKDKLANAGLFLRALDQRVKALPNLVRSHIGNYMVHDSKVRRMVDLLTGAPALEMSKMDQIAALPLGGRIRVNPWDNSITLLKTKPVELLSAREKMPFELTPIFLYLKRAKTTEVANQTLKRE